MLLFKVYLKMISSVRKKIYLAIVSNACIKANSLFPDATLNENIQLADFVTGDILGISDDLKNKEEKEEFAEQLRKSLFSDKNVIDTVANYFLIEHFRFSFTNADGHNKDLKKGPMRL